MVDLAGNQRRYVTSAEVPNLSAVIVNWNGEALLPACLGPLARSGCQVIVVDNASTDGSLALLNEFFPWVELIVNTENRGFAAANNQGIARASGEVVLLLNSDTVPDPAALVQLMAFFGDNPLAAVAGPTLIWPDGRRQPSCGQGPNLWTEFLAKTMAHRLIPGLREMAPEVNRRVEWVTGAALAIRRQLAQELGGLDEHMFMFYEDLELCARVREAGGQVWFVATVPIVHIGGASRRRVEAVSLIHSYESSLYFFSRHGPHWRRGFVRAFTVPEMALRSAVWALLWADRRRRELARERLRAYGTILRQAVTGR